MLLEKKCKNGTVAAFDGDAGPMDDLASAFALALRLVLEADPELLGIVALSLRVSLTAVAIACLIGMPLGALLATVPFPGRSAAVVVVNALMGLPPVVVGLLVYLLLSRSGPLGVLGLLYTPAAMVIAQTILVTPIVAALSRAVLVRMEEEYGLFLRALAVGRGRALLTLLYEARFALLTVALAGFGRAIAEVGAVMMVGGNIRHVTRVMTTAIALETAKGEIALALGLGVILLALALAVNALVHLSARLAGRDAAHVAP